MTVEFAGIRIVDIQAYKMKRSNLLLLLPILLFSSCHKKDEFGTKIVVPDDVSSIQKAIKIADPHDTILIRPGEYFEHDINVTKPVFITSEYKTLADTPIIRKTIINGNQESRVFHISNVTDTIGMNGFTIKGGFIGKKNEVSIEADYGGGIFLINSHLKISNLQISGNIASQPNQNGAGAGLYIDGSFLSVSNCKIHNNSSIDIGGAFWCTGSTLIIHDSNISNNRSQREHAINITNSELDFRNVLLENNFGPFTNAVYFCSGTFENVTVTGISFKFDEDQIVFTNCSIPGQ
jgi:hypothetical protein